MEDCPRNLAELESRFSTEAACRQYLLRLRWPEGFRCPRCGGQKTWPSRGTMLQCANCRHQNSVMAGTIFQDSRKPLSTWFRAIWWVVSHQDGATAMGLQRFLGIGSYKTAWTWLHKLRRAMVPPRRYRLTGRVELDESYLGGLEGMRGRQRALIVIAAQKAGTGIGQIRMRRIPNASARRLIPFVQDSVAPGSIVYTYDDRRGYLPLKSKGYVHRPRRKKSESELMPRVDEVVFLLKRWLMRTHRGAVSPKHLDYYLDEFTFRFSRRRSHTNGELFVSLLRQTLMIEPAPYKSMVKGSASQ